MIYALYLFFESHSTQQAGNYDKAIFYYDEAIDMDANNGVYHNNKVGATQRIF